MILRVVFLLCLVLTAQAQTVSGQTAVSGQTVTFTISAKKIPKLLATISCTGPQDSTGVYQVVAGSSISCNITLNLAAPLTGATLTLSSNSPDFIVPTSVVIASGAFSTTFQLTATP